MADKQIVPYDHASKALAPIVEEPTPLATIPPPIPSPRQPPHRPPSLPPPQGHEQAFFAQPVNKDHLHQEAKLKKPIKVPEWMEIQKPRPGEALVSVKKDEYGNMKEHKYTTASRLSIDGVRAHAGQIKKIPMLEAAQRMSGSCRNKRTIAELTKDVDFLRNLCSNIQRTHCSLSNSVLRLLKKENLDRKHKEERDEGCNPKKGKGPM